MVAYVLYLRMIVGFPSWTSWVRTPSPAPFRINSLRRFLTTRKGAFLWRAERRFRNSLILGQFSSRQRSQTE